MAKKANPTAVGGFVLGAAALLVGGTIAVGRGRFFRDDIRYVCHFESSVAGLDIGAPVRFNGVKVGEVSDISAIWRLDENGIHTPVTLSFSRDSIQPPPGTTKEEFARRDPVEIMNGLIEDGLRAELFLDSFVTGKLYVALKSYPDSPVTLRGRGGLPELPTREAGLVRFAKSIGDLPIEELVQEILETIRSIRSTTKGLEIRETVADLRSLLNSVDAEVEPLATSVRETLGTLRDTATAAGGSLETTSADVRATLRELRERITPLSEAADGALASLRATLDSMDGSLGGDSDLLFRATLLMEDLAEAARSIRGLARTLERHPEALISGKPQR